MKLNERNGIKARRTAASFAAALAAMFATSAAMATDLENVYFRYDFSDGTRQFIGSASQASDPVTEDADAANFVAAYGQDGAATAVHVTKNAYGSDKIGGAAATGRTVLAGTGRLRCPSGRAVSTKAYFSVSAGQMPTATRSYSSPPHPHRGSSTWVRRVGN